MKRKVTELRRTAREQAEALIANVSQPDVAPEFFDLIASLPTLFETTLGYLLSEFDYDANAKSNTAIAIRLLAAGAERFQQLQSRAARA